MADGKVTVDLEVTGAAESAADVRRLQSSLRQYGSAARQAGTQADGLSRNLQVNAQQAAAATNQTGQMAGALGNVASVIATVNPQAGALASQIGALGTAVSATSSAFGVFGGAVGALTLAIGAAYLAHRNLTEQQGRLRQSTDRANRSLSEQVAQLRQIRNEEELLARVRGGSGSADEQAGFRRQARDEFGATNRERVRLTQQLAAARRRAGRAGIVGTLTGSVGAQAEVTRLQRRIRELNRQADQQARVVGIAGQMQQDAEAAEGADAAAARRSGGGGGRSRGQPDDLTFKEVSNFEFLQAQEEERARLAEERRRREAEAERNLADEMEAMRQELFDASTERWRVEMARREDLAEKEQENLAYQIEQQREASEQLRADAEAVLVPVVGGLTSALAEVVAGTKSADEAFTAMLSSFLSMISERAALEAAAQFAAAIASAATGNFPGAAGQIAAGVAWTAVAVAAGGAAIATQPQVDNAPREPESTGGGGGGGTVVVNWNSPIVTATTRAELGRDLGQLGREGDRRLGVSR
jgi:hypothetical protein